VAHVRVPPYPKIRHIDAYVCAVLRNKFVPVFLGLVNSIMATQEGIDRRQVKAGTVFPLPL
jgi:hypothetical protein